MQAIKPFSDRDSRDRARTPRSRHAIGGLPLAQASGDNLPLWQREREQLLKRVCLSVQKRIENGMGFLRAVQAAAKLFQGRQFKSDPSRKLRLSKKTLIRIFYAWDGGMMPAAFRLKYVYGRQSVFTSQMLTRFIQFIIDRPQPSLAVAWRKFSELGGNWGPGRRGGKPLRPSYFQIRWALPTSLFYQIRAEQKAIAAARATLEKLQTEADATVRAKYPERPPRKRMRRQPDFQI